MNQQFPVIQKLPFTILLVVLLTPLLSRAQGDSVLNFPGKAISSIERKYCALDERMDNQLAKSLSRFAKQERKLQQKLAAKDSTTAALFAGAQERYAELHNN